MTLYCKDCERDGRKSIAFVTVHDRRGCHHLCWIHAGAREHASFMLGHSSDCPFADASEAPRSK